MSRDMSICTHPSVQPLGSTISPEVKDCAANSLVDSACSLISKRVHVTDAAPIVKYTSKGCPSAASKTLLNEHMQPLAHLCQRVHCP